MTHMASIKPLFAGGVLRHVALLRPDAGGLLVTLQREADSIGMLPWYSNDSTISQYWFAPALDRP